MYITIIKNKSDAVIASLNHNEIILSVCWLKKGFAISVFIKDYTVSRLDRYHIPRGIKTGIAHP